MKGSEIQNLVFSISFLGYKKADIKACLREISEYVLKLENKVYNLEVERDKLKDKLNKNEISQTNFKDIITSAQEFKNRIEIEAEEKAKEIIKKAKRQYEEILKSIKNEKMKFVAIKREVENIRKTFLDKLDNFENILEMKEKNISTSESQSYKSSINELEDEVFDVKKIVKMSNSDGEKKLDSETLEFDTKPNASSNESHEKNYIKSKFREIELNKF